MVCLPPATATADLAGHARDALAVSPFASGTPITRWNPVAHFAVRRRLRGRRLLEHRGRVAAGWPIRLLDLTRMRLAARAGAWHRWLVWHRVVSGTPRATPWWVHATRHHTTPDRYPLARARQDDASQPRIHAVRVHNLLAACTGHVEDLAAAYGDTSEAYRHAVSSWLRCLTSLLDLALGANDLRGASRPRSLLVRTSSGLEYGVIFHPAHAPAHGRPGPTPATWCTHS